MTASITREQAETIATSLFPNDVHDGRDCRAEIGREGQRCRFCEERWQDWQACVERVQNAVTASLRPAS